MDGILSHHRTPRRIAQGPGGVPDGRLISLNPRGKDGGTEAKRPAGGGGPGKELSRGFVPRRTLTETVDKDRGIADGASVHIKWDVNGCAGMA